MSSHAIIQTLNSTVPVPEEKFASPYIELTAGYQVHNRYLRIALLCTCTVILLLCGVGFKLASAIRNIEPLIVRVSEVGEPTIAPYAALSYRLREPEAVYFLEHFVQDKFSRIRATIPADKTRVVCFLTAELARASMDEERQSRSVAKFLASTDEDVEVYVTRVSIEDLRQAPYKATVDFDKVYRAYGTGQELRREKHTAHIVFTMENKIDDKIRRVNPIGLMVTYVRSDMAF
jgi:hypothetical protein